VHNAFVHFVLLLVALATSALGWFIAHNPQRTFRFFTFAAEPGPKVFVGFLRVCGWFFTVFFGTGVLFYLGLIAHDLLR
jgi:hypothetical protein